jgi:CxxC motif-containing protein (DUF1111 family)
MACMLDAARGMAGGWENFEAPLEARGEGMRFWYGLLGLLIISGAAAQSTSLEETFNEVEVAEDGLGPRFNLDSCGGCHSHPKLGGSSPASNPQVDMATAFGAQNVVPSFIKVDGPIREVRFKSDSQVHALFVITGRSDIPGDTNPPCTIKQEDFEKELQKDNVIFRIPTPLFGAGMVEGIDDGTISANRNNPANADRKGRLGIRGKLSIVNGRVGRFGWKAQHFDLEAFAGEAYNVEMGITNELSQDERELQPNCQYGPVPLNSPGPTPGQPSDVQLFAEFMRALPPPQSKPNGFGRSIFDKLGCDLCHTPELAGVQLFSDLQLHDMGEGLADRITQGNAGPREFRSAPLWGVGQRLFLLHDGRTRDLGEAIQAHASTGSEANEVIKNFQALTPKDQGALLDFLRSL